MFSTETDSGYPINVPNTFKGYIIVDEISKGCFSTVVKIMDTFTERYYAAKIISKTDMKNQNSLRSIYNEIENHRSLSNANIAKFYESFEITNSQKEQFIVIVIEYCSKGCLLDYINKDGFKDVNEMKKILYGIVNAVNYLHVNQIAHCDIKPENILLDKDLTPKLCDFGFSKNFTKSYDESKCGSLDYAAPELFKPGNVDFFKSDVWAVGITLFAASEKKFPFGDIYDVINGNLHVICDDKKLKELVKKCTDMDPKKRPNMDDILNDDFFLFDDD